MTCPIGNHSMTDIVICVQYVEHMRQLSRMKNSELMSMKAVLHVFVSNV